MKKKGLSSLWVVSALLFILSPLTDIVSVLAQTEDLIENIEIRISGAKDRVDELLRSIDWRQLATALGR